MAASSTVPLPNKRQWETPPPISITTTCVRSPQHTSPPDSGQGLVTPCANSFREHVPDRRVDFGPQQGRNLCHGGGRKLRDPSQSPHAPAACIGLRTIVAEHPTPRPRNEDDRVRVATRAKLRLSSRDATDKRRRVRNARYGATRVRRAAPGRAGPSPTPPQREY